MRKRRGKEVKGRDEPKKTSSGQATKDYNAGQTLDELTTRKPKSKPVEGSD